VAIPVGLEEDVEDVAVLVHGSPDVLPLAADSHEEFVEVPRVADGPGPMAEPPRIGEAEGLAPVRIDSYDTVTPRWARRSSTSRKLRLKR